MITDASRTGAILSQLVNAQRNSQKTDDRTMGLDTSATAAAEAAASMVARALRGQPAFFSLTRSLDGRFPGGSVPEGHSNNETAIDQSC